MTLGTVGAVGLVFAGVTAVAAQVTEHARGTAITLAVLGLAFVLRAAGDVGDRHAVLVLADRLESRPEPR